MPNGTYNNNLPQRQMFDVSKLGLKCMTCGRDVLELPFQPDINRPVYCKECNKRKKENLQK
jgi:CxxC-x17-CxxC domain-containing protein